MNQPLTPVGDDALDDPRVIGALDEYVAAWEAGRRLDRAAFLAAHADVAEALAKCLDGLNLLKSAAAQLDVPVEAVDIDRATPLGDYRLLRVIGRGGMGIVYEAEQMSLGRRVALKVLPFAAALDPRQLLRFKNEAQAAAHLQHPNIVPVYGVGCERGVHYYAMQFVEGHSLAQVIRELREQAGMEPKPNEASAAAPSAVTQAAAAVATQRAPLGPKHFRLIARLGWQAALALEHAHQVGVIHRDIKPANMLVDADDKLWITDFGLAQFHGHGGLTMTGDVLGTLRYMSPEQASGRREIIDHRADIYSLGATLYELVTLQTAMLGDDRAALVQRIAHVEPEPPRRLHQAIPVDLETIILKAMAKASGDRYATAQELADDLERFLADQPIRARPPTLLQRARKWGQRHRASMLTSIISSMLFLVAAVTILAWSTLHLDRERAETARQRDAAQASFRELHGAIDEYFTLISENTLLDVPGLQPLRRELLGAALRHYQEFLEKRGDDPTLRADVALAHFRLAHINHTLDASEEAIRQLDKGLAVAERLTAAHAADSDATAARRRLAGAIRFGRFLHRAIRPPDDMVAAEKVLRRGVSIWEQLVQEHPRSAGFRSDLASLSAYLADLQRDQRRFDEALASAARARGLCERLADDEPAKLAHREALADIQSVMGTLCKRVHRNAEGEHLLRGSIKLYDGLLAEAPKAPHYRRGLGTALTSLGNLLTLDNPAAAGDALRRGQGILAELVADFSHIPAYREDLAVSTFDRANLLWRQQLPGEAEKLFGDAVMHYEKLSAEFPDKEAYRQRLATYHAYQAFLCEEGKRFPDAKERHQRRLAMLHTLAADFPANHEHRHKLAEAYVNYGDGLTLAGQAEEADRAYRQALAIREALVADVPGRALYQRELAWFLATCPIECLRDPVRALDLAAKAVSANPRSAGYHTVLGAACYRNGDWFRAVAALEKARGLNPDGDGADFFFLALAYAKQGKLDDARSSLQQGIAWMAKYQPRTDELPRLRVEAEAELSKTK